MTVPKKLRKGDTVALLATSGPCDRAKISPAAVAIESWGLQARVMESCYAQEGYLAGEDALRVQDLHMAFTDPTIQGIFVFRGGYGAQRLLPLLDFKAIGQNPKIFAGYSDVTALHTVFNQRCGFITYHAPMMGIELYQTHADPATLQSFLAQVMECGQKKRTFLPLTPVAEGRAQGILAGGNLSLLAVSLGTPYEIDTRGKVLFIEEIDEAPYKIDRMLLQLKLAGKLQDCRGIVLGSFLPETFDNTLQQAISELLIPLGKPIGANLSCGHCLPNLTLPLGAKVRLDIHAEGRLPANGVFVIL